MASGSTYWDYETVNNGWWDPGGYWYTNGPNVWEAHFPVVGVGIGEGLSRIRLWTDMGDLGDGQNYMLLNGAAQLGGTGGRGGCGSNGAGGANDCGWAVVVDWQAASPADYVRNVSDIRGRVTPAATGNQQHYMFNQRMQIEWWSSPFPRRAQIQPL